MPHLMETAIRAATSAGEYLRQNRGKLSPENIDEKARNDFVTTVDRNSEKLIVDILRDQFPEHRILAEEGGLTQSGSQDYRWIIDPLDGTKNFIQNIPVFCISIALQFKGEIILGVVYDPVHDELFSAEKGAGAFCNSQPAKVSSRDFRHSVIATGFPFKSKNHIPAYLLTFEEIFLKCSGMRRLGSAALDLSYTAIGRFEGFFELGLSIWDLAAGTLLIQEAGGVVSDFWGGKRYLNTGFVVAGNPAIQPPILEITRYHFPEDNFLPSNMEK